jgi:hypothetical protein
MSDLMAPAEVVQRNATKGAVTAQVSIRVALPTTPDVELLVRRAAWIRRGEGDSQGASVTALVVALFACTDPVSLWVQDKATWIGPTVDELLQWWNLPGEAPRGRDLARVRAARTLTLSPTVGEGIGITRALFEIDLEASTAPAVTVIERARELAQGVGSKEVDVRHVFAALLYNPPTRRAESRKGWKVDREAWATRFRCYLTADHPAEAAAWRQLHDESFPRKPTFGGGRFRVCWSDWNTRNRLSLR